MDFVDEENHTLKELISNAQKAIAGPSNPQSPEQERESAVLESIEIDVSSASESPHRDIVPFSPPPENVPRLGSIEANNSLSIIRERLQKSTVPEFMVHLPTELIHHYFSQVCKIFSSFDGSLNPFRSTISKLFQSSAPIYYGIQSMAAAYLANHIPRMALVGVQMQQEAYKCLSQLLRDSSNNDIDKALLSMLLIGQTTCWHNTSDLGLQHLDMAKKLNRKRHTSQTLVPNMQRQNQFFDQCLLYWEMVASYVADRDNDLELDDTGQLDYRPGTATGDDTNSSTSSTLIFPHPWTGIAADVQKMFSQVGCLIRRFRRTSTSHSSMVDFLMLGISVDGPNQPDSASQSLEITAQARVLEEKLLAFELPSVSRIADAKDENTPAEHYILLAEAYKCAALLGIYRVFPSVFQQRSPLVGLETTAAVDNGTPHQFLDNFTSLGCSSPSEWLVSLAIHTLSLLQQIPITSGTRCLQPLVFITAAAELRFPDTAMPSFAMPYAQPITSSLFSGISERETEIAQMRDFVMSRIQEFKQNLPAKPMLKAELLIRETWARLDMGQDIYWMDVMHELHCETIFG